VEYPKAPCIIDNAQLCGLPIRLHKDRERGRYVLGSNPPSRPTSWHKFVQWERFIWIYDKGCTEHRIPSFWPRMKFARILVKTTSWNTEEPQTGALNLTQLLYLICPQSKAPGLWKWPSTPGLIPSLRLCGSVPPLFHKYSFMLGRLTNCRNKFAFFFLFNDAISSPHYTATSNIDYGKPIMWRRSEGKWSRYNLRYCLELPTDKLRLVRLLAQIWSWYLEKTKQGL